MGFIPPSTQSVPLGLYTFALNEVPGVVAANNFLSIFNPSTSGVVLVGQGLIVNPYATAGTSVTNNMTLSRITTASGGSLVAKSTIPKFSLNYPNSVMEIRTANPTVTTSGITIASIPPAITGAGAGISPQFSADIPLGDAFTVPPGNGLVLSTAIGTVAQLWNIALIWAEAKI